MINALVFLLISNKPIVNLIDVFDNLSFNDHVHGFKELGEVICFVW